MTTSAHQWRTRLCRTVAGHRSALAVVAVLIGVLVGAASLLFDLMIHLWSRLLTGFEDYPSHAGQAHGTWGWAPWVFLLLAPVVSALLYGPLVQRFAPSARGHGIPEVMLAVQRKGGRIPGRVAVVKLVASSLTIGGGSAGREGPIVQVGASLGSSVATLLALPTSRVILLASCGAAGGIAATFHAPLAGAVFALEVILVSFTAEAFGYVVLSSVAASVVATVVRGDHPLVDLGVDLSLPAMQDMAWIALLGFLAGLAGLGFSKLLYLVEDGIDWLWERIRLPEWSRPVVLGVALGAALIAFPQMYGSGQSVQLAALRGDFTIPFLLLLLFGRALLTSWTIGMGGSGGVFAPTLFMGAMVGVAFGQGLAPLSSTPAAVFGVIGMGAAFAGAARAPMTAVLIIVEMTGQYGLILPMMLAVVIATAVSRFLTRATIYTEKLRRRGDVLDEPVDHTLLGRRPASRLMRPLPAVLSVTDEVAHAISLMRRSCAASLPVCEGPAGNGATFVGSVSALDLAALVAQGLDPHTALSEVRLDPTHVCEDDLPSRVLDVLANGRTEGIPVLPRSFDEGAAAGPVGWITRADLVELMNRDQHRALAAGRESSWGSRWRERHSRSSLR
ncbi:chloride channel protein [Schaalia sp. 19OD2882]|uniref:chloride channel protein n=1 Tax=Schaalia sp. 19OD2882 TaxID=2794089 RepID=UPI001C1F02E4|nr:chloride channel protein [Schaalia sp. 19OD2882]QWW20441.1 chloride channel protein [Schaalia sp. 19OD2882]